MLTDAIDRSILAAIEQGLPLDSRPYATVAQALGLEEADVMERLAQLQERGVVKRLGLVVRHQELGYRANAMVVWDVPDDVVDAVGARIGEQTGITLCYRRPRRPPIWPYNLYCMIHGRERAAVEARIALLIEECGLAAYPTATLFSTRRFKQRGPTFRPNQAGAA